MTGMMEDLALLGLLPDIELQKRVSPRIDRRTHDTVRFIHRVIDEVLDVHRARGAANGIPIVCRRGCAACCTYPVQVSPEEASIMADAVHAMPSKLREQTIARLVAWERAWALDQKEDIADVGPWQARRIACPLLNLKTHDCSVYPDRPIACRGHHATRIPVDDLHPECGKCKPRQPPEGCFTTDVEVSHNHKTSIWQLDPEINMKGLYQLTMALEKDVMEAGFLVPLVLSVGRYRYKWPAPRKMVKLDVLNSSFPKGLTPPQDVV